MAEVFAAGSSSNDGIVPSRQQTFRVSVWQYLHLMFHACQVRVISAVEDDGYLTNPIPLCRDMPVKTSVSVVLKEWGELEPRLETMSSVQATSFLRAFVSANFAEPGK